MFLYHLSTTLVRICTSLKRFFFVTYAFNATTLVRICTSLKLRIQRTLIPLIYYTGANLHQSKTISAVGVHCPPYYTGANLHQSKTAIAIDLISLFYYTGANLHQSKTFGKFCFVIKSTTLVRICTSLKLGNDFGGIKAPTILVQSLTSKSTNKKIP